MDSYFRLGFFSLILLLSSCAQVGTISGGQKDIYAPKPLENKTLPENGTTEFKSSSIRFEFDEYFKLNNPQENITIIPLGPKIKTKVEKRKLILDLEGTLAENTTYQITFNDAIKDLNEGNDSLMHYVFSTGKLIDSLSYSGKIADAYSNELQGNILVGLYKEGDSILSQKPHYFAKTAKNGEFKLEYLKAGIYQVYAFDDKNKDLKFQLTEKVGFRTELLYLDSSLVDSLALLIYQSKLLPKITSKSYVFPLQVQLASNSDLRKTKWTFEDTIIDSKSIHYYRNDSIILFLPRSPKEDFFLTSDGQFDTIFLKKGVKSQKAKYEFEPKTKDISETQEISFIFSDKIIGFDTALIFARTVDSIILHPIITPIGNKVHFSFNKNLSSSIEFFILPKALLFSIDQYNDSIREKFTVRAEKEFATIIFKNTNFPSNSFIEFVKAGKAVKQISCEELKKNPVVKFIEGGEYSFRIVLDENQNQKWDDGDVLKFKQAEKVLHFTEKVKVRANWETEVELEVFSTPPLEGGRGEDK